MASGGAVEWESGHGWSFWGKSITGAVRTRQEDTWVIHVDSKQAAAAVFDGVGGYPNGKEAAQAAATEFPDACRDGGPLLERLGAAVRKTGGNTTCVAVLIVPSPRVVSVGDSSAYVLEDDEPRLLNPLDRSGGALTDCLGLAVSVGHELPLEADQVLLCSDGVDGVVPGYELARALRAAPKGAQKALEALMRAVEKAGAPDNATVVLALRE